MRVDMEEKLRDILSYQGPEEPAPVTIVPPELAIVPVPPPGALAIEREDFDAFMLRDAIMRRLAHS